MVDYPHSDEVTLKEIILKVQEYIREIKANLWVLLLFVIPAVAFFLYSHFTHIPEYKAELRFVVEGQSGVRSGLGGVLGSIGINSGTTTNPYKILEVGKSSTIFEKVAFADLSDQYIANQLLTEYELIEKWSKKSDVYKGFEYKDAFLKTDLDKRVYKKLHKLIWGTPLNQDEALSSFLLDEEKGIFTLSTKSTSEQLSIALTEKLYEGVKSFFEDEIFENQKKSAEILKFKVDSIYTLRGNKIYELAQFMDRNTDLIYNQNSSRIQLLKQEIQTLSSTYAELLKNYEMTDVSLKDIQPLFKELERPFTPIVPSRSSLLRSIIFGLVLGLFLGVIYLMFKKFYRDIMK